MVQVKVGLLLLLVEIESELQLFLLDLGELSLVLLVLGVGDGAEVGLDGSQLLVDALRELFLLSSDLGGHDINLVGNLHLVKFGILAHLLAVGSLQVLEQRGRTDLDLSDLESLKPDAPPLDDLKHLLLDLVLDSFSVTHHLLDCRVGNAGSHDG